MAISPTNLYLQRLMQNFLGDLKLFTTFYCDDIIVFSKTLDCWNHLKQVFERLRNVRLPINTSKYQFAKTNVNFVGNNISVDGIRPLKDRISALNNYPKPKTVQELHSFLGAVNFCRQYILKITWILKLFNNLYGEMDPNQLAY